MYLPASMSKNIYCQDWYNASGSSAIRSWHPGLPVPSPWKARIYSPLRSIPGADHAWRIRIDPAHTYAIQGFGSTLATGSCVLLCHMRLAPGRSLNARLQALYMNFKTWCLQNRKPTSLTSLSMKKLKMKSRPDLINGVLRFVTSATSI